MEYRYFYPSSLNGKKLPKSKVTVYVAGTQTKAVLYDVNEVPLGENPIFADENGEVAFSTFNGAYDLAIEGGVYSNVIRSVRFFDPEASATSVSEFVEQVARGYDANAGTLIDLPDGKIVKTSGAGNLEGAPGWEYRVSSRNFSSLVDLKQFVSLLKADGVSILDGEMLFADGLAFVADRGANAIDGLPDFVPAAKATLKHFGAFADGVTLDEVAVSSASQFQGVVDGEGRRYAVSQLPPMDRFRRATFVIDGVEYHTHDMTFPELIPAQFDAPGSLDTLQRSSVTLFDGGFHRHFGGIARDQYGRIHLVYRKAAGHLTEYEGVIAYAVVTPSGDVLSAERAIVPSTIGVDHRDPGICITPTGRLVVTYCDPSSSDGNALVPLRSIYSDDGGATWSDPVTFAQVYGARTYGTPKVVKLSDGSVAILATAYYRNSGSTERTLAVYKSTDGGRNWTEQTPVYQGSQTQRNEFEVEFVTSSLGFAASRYNGGSLRWSVTTDGGQTWSAPVAAAWSGSADVAPTINTVWLNGIPYIVLGWCDRSADRTMWAWAKATDVIDGPEAFGDKTAQTQTDMIEASGYQKGVVLPDGQMLYVSYRESEYPAEGIEGEIDTTVRLASFPIARYVSGLQGNWTPRLVGSTAAGSPTYSFQNGGFTRVGDIVHATAAIILNDKGGISGNLSIEGLPFEPADGAQHRAAATVGFQNGLSLPTEAHIFGFILNGKCSLYLPSSTGHTSLNDTHITDSATLYLTFSYRAAS